MPFWSPPYLLKNQIPNHSSFAPGVTTKTTQQRQTRSPRAKHQHEGERKKRERKTTQAAKSSSHQLRKRGHLGRTSLKSPFTRKEESSQWGSGGSQADKPADLSWLVWRWGKCSREQSLASGLNKLMSIVHRMGMELENKFLDSL